MPHTALICHRAIVICFQRWCKIMPTVILKMVESWTPVVTTWLITRDARLISTGDRQIGHMRWYDRFRSCGMTCVGKTNSCIWTFLTRVQIEDPNHYELSAFLTIFVLVLGERERAYQGVRVEATKCIAHLLVVKNYYYIIIIIIIISYMRGLCTHIPETNYVPRE